MSSDTYTVKFVVGVMFSSDLFPHPACILFRIIPSEKLQIGTNNDSCVVTLGLDAVSLGSTKY